MLPVDAVPVQCADDARCDLVANAVRPRAPRHVRRSPGHRPSGSGAHAPDTGPMHPGCPGRPGRGRLGPARLNLARFRRVRFSLGLDDRGPLNVFRCFRSLRSFRAFRCIRGLGRRRSGPRLDAAERQAPIGSLSSGGGQNKSCNENKFTHVRCLPLRSRRRLCRAGDSQCETGHARRSNRIARRLQDAPPRGPTNGSARMAAGRFRSSSFPGTSIRRYVIDANPTIATKKPTRKNALP